MRHPFAYRLFVMLAACATAGSIAACSVSPTPLDSGQDASASEPAPADATSATDKTVEQTDSQSAEPAEKTEAQTNDDAGAVTTSDDVLAVESFVTSETAAEVGASADVMPDFDTEEYAAVEESGFVAARTTPLSTVSADVDTASYANLRRMLNEGYRMRSAVDADDADDDADDADEGGSLVAQEEDGEPLDSYDDYYGSEQGVIPSGAVRIEEMLNYFDYDYPTPEGDDAFAITSRIGPCPWNDDTELLVIGCATAPEDEKVRNKGANLVFLIDVSGSMDDADKLPLLQSSFGELVSTLGENDRVSIVTYSGEEEVVLEGAKGTESRKIMKAIRGLSADGSTNGEAGLRMAYQVARDNFIKGGVNRIVMASDGDLNVGMTSESDLHDFVEDQRESGVYLSVLGFGAGNYKDTKMETLADHGNGSYHYIDCEDEAKRVFGERLCANLVPFADDVKVQVEFNPAQVKGYRLVGYENRTLAAEDFEDDEKDAGEVGPSSQFTVVYEVATADSKMDIEVPELKYEQGGGASKTSDEWLTVSLRYKPLGSDDSVEQQAVVDEADWKDDPGEDWSFAAAVTEFGMLLRDSEYAGTSTLDTVRDLVGTTKDEARLGFIELVDMAEKN